MFPENPEPSSLCLCVSVLPVLTQAYSSGVYGLLQEGDGFNFILKEDHPAIVSGEKQVLRTNRNREMKDGQVPGMRLEDTVLYASTPSQRACDLKHHGQ